MGQINSRCSFHHLPTEHSEEGFCAPCEERFSSLRGRDRDNKHAESKFDGKDFNYEDKNIFDEAVEVKDTYHWEPDTIFHCVHCTRFFYTENALQEHIAALTTEDLLGVSQKNIASGSYFCGICKRANSNPILEYLNSALLHIQRPEISKKDIETERVRNCCVRCGIYFRTKEQKRKHFRDVEHHIVHVQAESDAEEDESFSLSANLDFNLSDELDDLSMTQFPKPPSSLPLQAPLSITLNSSYAPELRVKGTGTVIRSHAGAQTIMVTEHFECPLCLENETDIASLACGHIFGTQCIHKTLAADSRCPLCRRPAERSTIRKVQSANN